MKKTHIIAGIVVILIVAGIVIVSAIVSAKERAAVKECESIPNTSPGKAQKADCYIELARTYNNPKYCENYHSLCDGVIASIRRDPSFCESSRNDKYTGDEKTQCYSTYAKLQNDTTFCQDTECLTAVAQNLKDITICDEKMQTQEDKDYCYHYVALGKKDSTLCAEIKGNIGITKERDQCYWDLALTNLNAEDCSHMSAGFDREYCYDDVKMFSETAN